MINSMACPFEHGFRLIFLICALFGFVGSCYISAVVGLVFLQFSYDARESSLALPGAAYSWATKWPTSF